MPVACVCICIYIYIYICIHTVYVCTYVRVCIHIYIAGCIHIYICNRIHTCIHTYVPTYIQAGRQTNMSKYIHACLHAYIDVFSRWANIPHCAWCKYPPRKCLQPFGIKRPLLIRVFSTCARPLPWTTNPKSMPPNPNRIPWTRPTLTKNSPEQ